MSNLTFTVVPLFCEVLLTHFAPHALGKLGITLTNHLGPPYLKGNQEGLFRPKEPPTPSGSLAN
jgi:hypothetical protein